VDQLAAKLQYGPGACHHHDGKHEKRFREIAGFEVFEGGHATHHGEHGDGQYHGPQAKYHLNLAQEVPDTGVARVRVGQVFKVLGAECVQHGQGKDASCDPRHVWVVHE